MKNNRFALALSVLTVSILSGTLAIPQAFSADHVGLQDGLRVNLVQLNGFYGTSEEKIRQAADLMERVLNSEEFHQAVISYTYKGKKEFANNDGMTNEQIYTKIMAARETYTPAEDHVADLDLQLYTPPWYKKWSVVGYTYAGKPRIYMNSYYFNSFTLANVAANMTHEWTHKIGFDHDYKRTARRPYSVPYAVGDIMGQIAEKFAK